MARLADAVEQIAADISRVRGYRRGKGAPWATGANATARRGPLTAR
jgi:hypothetical protein